MVRVICLCLFALASGAASAGSVEILEFTASWCGPCRTMAPAMERLRAAGYPLQIVDVDQSPQVAKQYGVTHLPTILLVQDGKEIGRRVGARSYVELVRWFKQEGVQVGSAAPSAPLIRGQSPDAAALPARQPTPRPTPASLPASQAPASPPARQSVGPPANATQATAGPAPSRATADNSGGPSAVSRALAATVRLRVEDERGYSFGTGTIIDVSGSDALIVTCGHIFRDSQGKGKITVDLFGAGGVHTVEGRLLGYEADRRDIGFVVIRPGIPVQSVPVAARSQPLQVGLPVFSIGCNRGADPTVEQTRITAVNRYAHGPNLEIEGQPIDGRSGGGLFSQNGELIGVCNAADPQENKGLYASLPLVHEHLAKLGLARLIRDEAVATAADGNRLAPVTMPSVPPTRSTVAAAQQPSTSSQRSAGADELICVVRDPRTGQQRVIVVKQPPRQLIAQLEAAAAPRRNMPAQPSPGPTPSGSRPIVRGQSQQ